MDSHVIQHSGKLEAILCIINALWWRPQNTSLTIWRKILILPSTMLPNELRIFWVNFEWNWPHGSYSNENMKSLQKNGWRSTDNSDRSYYLFSWCKQNHRQLDNLIKDKTQKYSRLKMCAFCVRMNSRNFEFIRKGYALLRENYAFIRK